MRRLLRSSFRLCLFLALARIAFAQEPPPAIQPQQPDPLPSEPIKPGDATEMTLLPDELPMLPSNEAPDMKPEPSPRLKLQMALDAIQPILPPLDPAFAHAPLVSEVKVMVKRFQFHGNHRFSDQALRRVVAKWEGRELTSDDLEAARVAITRHYVDAGYIASGAVLPDQDLEGGVVRFEIVEGRLAEIDLHGNFWFRGWWLRHQIRRAAGRPLNVNHLKTGLQLLRQDPGIRQVNAELMPGVRPEESVLHVTIKDQHPFRAGFEVNNYRPPSVAEGAGEFYFQDLNLTGHGDPLELHWGIFQWTKDGNVDYTRLDNIEGSYEMPITPWGTTLTGRYSRGNSSIIDETFARLGITSRSEQFGFTVRQPLYETLQNTVALAFTMDRKHSETYLLGRPFTLSLGAIDGESDVTAFRAVLEWVNRSQLHVLAFRSTFTLGTYDFGATRFDPKAFAGTTSGLAAPGFDPEIPDSKFFAWLGQGQYVLRLFDSATPRTEPDKGAMRILRESLLLVRGNVQLTDEPLLALEQFSLGGARSVRGYRENQLLRDNGAFVSAELRVPLWLAKDNTPIVTVAPFVDWGIGFNINKLDDQYRTLYSAGVGLIVRPSKYAQINVYWGHPFEDFPNSHTSLQDEGWHISVSINAF